MTKPQENSGPDLADAIRAWLQEDNQRDYRDDWYVSTNRMSNDEFKQLWPTLNPNVMHIGTLNGWGWIINIYNNRIETFQDLPWGGIGTEKQPLMAADPDFFRKLDEIIECIIEYRTRELRRRKDDETA
jgi:hypothetical protein